MKKQVLTYIKKIFTGRARITDKQKYCAIIYSVALVHCFLTVVFGYLRVYPLFIFNIASVITYLFASLLVHKERFWLVYYITYLEIILHSFVATIFIGWMSGFAHYIIALVPVGYYICYTMDTKLRKMVIATGSALFGTIAYLSCKVLSNLITPAYADNISSWELGLFIFNSVCTYAFLIVFSLIFISEIRFTQTQLRHQNEILERLANIDPLTGLYNRRSMQIFLNHAVETDTEFCLAMCDIDDFKKINDTHGHDAGDVVLKEISQIMRQYTDNRGYVCRWGGEEILILSNQSMEETRSMVEKIRRAIANHLFTSDVKIIRCSVTIGIAAHKSGTDIEDTIGKADNNLYSGKKSGKNRVVA
ncbi:MAG: GGDEF domain-containing protein [Lachnospiraceae bacterium]|nr:GGDEF domain-containing protein [Lachnospiraceae bacterium]